MKCPYCAHSELKVTDSRTSPETNAIRRRRECLACQQRFTTFEAVELTIQVRKRDGRYEDFQQDKLIAGVLAACRHTKVSHDQVNELAAQVTGRLMHRQAQVVETLVLGEMIMECLRRLDRVAYIRFACVYRRFKDIDEVVDEIQAIQSEPRLQCSQIKSENGEISCKK